MNEHFAENDAPTPYDPTDPDEAGFLGIPMPTAENDAPVRLTNACACGDCFHPVIGPNTDGEPCDWCRDCGCASADHTRMTRVIPPDVGRTPGTPEEGR